MAIKYVVSYLFRFYYLLLNSLNQEKNIRLVHLFANNNLFYHKYIHELLIKAQYAQKL